MMGRWGRTAALAAMIAGQALVVLPAQAQSDETPRVEVIAEGLDSPRGITVADDGTVYVVESGVGGDEHCQTQEGNDGEEVEVCYGRTSGVTRIAPDGEVTRGYVEGLPSVDFGEEQAGASDVAIAADGSLYITVGLGQPASARDELATEWAPAAMFGTLQHFDGEELTQVADIAQFEFDENPDGAPDPEDEGNPQPDSNPNAVLVTDDGVLVADAGGNTVVRVDPDTGAVELAAVLEERMTDAPPWMGMPEGSQIPMQSVPTSLSFGADGEVLIGELTGFPFPVGGARVYTLDADGEGVTVAEDGFTNTHGVTVRGDELFVVEMVRQGLMSAFETGDFTGALVRVREDGSRIALLRDILQAPTGVATGPDGMLYVTNVGILPNAGSVVRFDPSQAADAAIQAACPPDEVGGTDLSDIVDTTHEEAITCAVWLGIFQGYADGTFGPSVPITRGQLASTVARMIDDAGGELPQGSDRFSDVDGTAHEDAIEALAEADIVDGFEDGTFRPNAEVTRAQAVSILVAGYEHVTGEQLDAGEDAFSDDDGSPHEDAIDAAHAAGWINGVSADTFDPGASLARGQGASLLARAVSSLPAS